MYPHKFKKATPKDYERVRVALKGIVPEDPKFPADMSFVYKKWKGTIAMALASQGVPVPERWRHHPELRFKDSDTCALYAAINGFIPEKWMHHSPELHSNISGSVPGNLLRRHMEVPEEW